MRKLLQGNLFLLAVGWLLAFSGTRVAFAYDSLGNRTVMADSSGRTTSTFDALDRTASVVNPAGTRIAYSYTPVALRSGMQGPDGGRTTYVYGTEKVPGAFDLGWCN